MFSWWHITPNLSNKKYVKNTPLYNKYKYYIVDFDAVTETADIYYELTTESSVEDVIAAQLEIYNAWYKHL